MTWYLSATESESSRGAAWRAGELSMARQTQPLEGTDQRRHFQSFFI